MAKQVKKRARPTQEQLPEADAGRVPSWRQLPDFIIDVVPGQYLRRVTYAMTAEDAMFYGDLYSWTNTVWLELGHQQRAGKLVFRCRTNYPAGAIPAEISDRIQEVHQECIRRMLEQGTTTLEEAWEAPDTYLGKCSFEIRFEAAAAATPASGVSGAPAEREEAFDQPAEMDQGGGVGLLEPPPREELLQPLPPEQEPPEQASFVERERQRRRGRPKQQRPPILWQGIEQFAAETAEVQADLLRRFQDLLDRLAGTADESKDENKALANAINYLVRRLGVDLTYDGQPVDVTWRSGVFQARATVAGRALLHSNAGFPHLTVQPISPAEGVDLPSWLDRATRPRPSGGVASPE
jgi:hypothetical protein